MKLRKFFRWVGNLLLLLLLVWAIAVQSGCFSMRSTDAVWYEKLKKK